MSRLLFCTYLRALKNYKSPSITRQDDIVNALFLCASTNTTYEVSEQDASKYFRGRLKVPSEDILQNVKDTSITNPFDYLERFSNDITGKIINSSQITNLGKVLAYIILNDDSIESTQIIDYISNTTKKDLPNIEYSTKFLAGVLLFTLDCRGDMNDNSNVFATEITNAFCSNALIAIDKLIDDSRKPILSSDAKKFCHKYKKSIDLLPLCQIASLFDYQYELINPMYIDYCELDESDQHAIMNVYNYPLITINSAEEFNDAVDLFIKDIESTNLSSEGKTYCIRDYLDSSLNYGDYIPDEKYYDIYPCRCSAPFFRNNSTLDQFVDDYLFISEHKLDDSFPIPFDWIWDYFDFGNCNIKLLLSQLNLFIINSCASLRRYSKNLSSNPHLSISYNVENVKTLEDLHFLALLRLYETYL